MLKEISQIRVMGSDPRRWPKVPSEVELKAVLQRIYGFPDEYALKTYHSDLSNERKPLAIESKIFISQHVLAEQVAINSALKMLPLYARTILDLGSRDGRLFSELIKPGKMRGLEFKNYFGIELDVDSFKLLQQRLSYDSTAHAILGDITKLDEAIYRFQKDIESPVICIMQNTLGTIEGDGNWENVILQLKLLLDKFKNSEIILSLYKAVQPECSVDQIKKALEIIEQHENSDLRSGQDRLQEAIKLLGNGWLLPSYLYTKSQNGWPPDPDMLKQGKLSIPTSGYVSRQWTESDIGDILELLEAKIIDRNESEEFAVLRLSR